MKEKIYNALVNRQVGIKERYLKFHSGAHGIKKYISWFYLLWLNFCYYVLQCRFLGITKEMVIYEEKKLLLSQSESSAWINSMHLSVDEYVARLAEYDIISFDIFDTLIFRPFSEPTDLFFFIGEKLGVMNFKQIRMQMEKEAREKCYREKGHYEVTLQEIWEQMELETGLSAMSGMQVEIETEKSFCYANPFMQEVFQKLQKQGKEIIIVSDMYLSREVLENVLQDNGYCNYNKLYVSCEYGRNKAGGQLYELVKQENPGRIIHVGDNMHSDIDMAKKKGLSVCYYPNVNKKAKDYRSYDMSPMIGGAYRGLVNNRLYSGNVAYSMEYEYGFVYGGLFTVGYCAYIHDYCKKNNIDKVLFLSRDGDVLKRAYDKMFPGENTEYAYWSRKAATKLMVSEDRYDYFRRFLFHKVNQGIAIEKVLSSMGLQWLLDKLPQELSAQSKLTSGNVEVLKQFLLENWDDVVKTYDNEQVAAKLYYSNLLNGCKKAVAVDIGWAGSGAVALNHLVQKVWNLPCEVIGIIAGTNTIHNTEPEASETFLQSGKLVAYLYSQSLNRDLLKKHDPNRDYNVYWELLLSSPTPHFDGFSLDEENSVELVFGAYDKNQEGILDIQRGILDFVSIYEHHFGAVSYMKNISGRDAYAPMLLAASKEERYLNEIKRRFFLDKNVS